jgi:ADP-ribosylglycohydrolase
MTTIATLVGCAIGDALGVPFEMKSWQFPALKKWNGSFRDGGTISPWA